MFVPHAVPKLSKNLTVKLAVDSLTRVEEFLVKNALNVKKKKHQHGLDVAANWKLLFFFFLAVNLATFTATTAAFPQGHNHKSMFYHPL
jgi:hypothetical protein